jgi:hypothetical protein
MKNITGKDENFEFLVALKKSFPKPTTALPIILPATHNKQMMKIVSYLEWNIGEKLTGPM